MSSSKTIFIAFLNPAAHLRPVSYPVSRQTPRKTIWLPYWTGWGSIDRMQNVVSVRPAHGGACVSGLVGRADTTALN